VLVGCAVSVLAIYLLLQQVRPEAVGEAISHADPRYLAILSITVILSLLTRAARWQVLFLPRYQVPFRPALGTLSISYMASTFLPLRAGELVRAVLLGKRESIAFPNVVGTILLEKLFDFLALGVMLGLLIRLTPDLPVLAQVGGVTIVSVILAGFGFVVALAIWRAPTLAAVKIVEDLVPFNLGHRFKLEQAARDFAEGTDSLKSGRLWIRLLFWTLITWLCSLASIWAGMQAVGIAPLLPSILFVAVLTSTSQSVPSSPGYVGVYHYFATLALTLFGVDQEQAVAFAVLSHAFSYGTLVIAGLIALWTGGYSMSDLFAGVRLPSRGALSPNPQSPPSA